MGHLDPRKFLSTILDEMNEQDEINKWLDQLPAKNKDEPFKSYLETSAAFALFTTWMGWRVTNQLDDPWRSGISSQMPRTLEDIQKLLAGLIIGISHRDLPLLEGYQFFDDLKAKLGPPPPNGESVVRRWSDMGIWQPIGPILRAALVNWMRQTSKTARKLGTNVNDERGVQLIEKTLSKLGGYLIHASI